MSLSTEFPRPFPSARQLKWHALEAYAFAHFSINTFTGKEWGYGDESPTLFDPTEFDADQIVGAVAAAGLKGFLLTCKHHDGFCLWPSPLTEHSVKNSPWKNGQGDIVREFSDACARHNIKFGVYLSPWDRNRADYGTPQYVEYFRDQLRDLLTNYGPIFEVWFDGANGGDGYYGGARETRTIDKANYYDWENTWQIVRELQPDACIFSKDLRWVGNERGFAGDPCWATLHNNSIWPGHLHREQLNRGDRDGTRWLPAEVDVSSRPGWFFHEEQRIKPLSHLLKIYFESVGRGASLLLNVTPDRRGLLPEHDVAVLTEWNRVLSQTFAADVAAGAQQTKSENEIVLDWGEDRTFNVINLREELPLGQRVGEFALDFWDGNAWQQFAQSTSIGNRKLIQTEDITTDKVRLRITEAWAPAAIREFALFQMAEFSDEQSEEKEGTLDRANWKIVSASSGMESASHAIGGNLQTLWTAESDKAEIVVDMGASTTIGGFVFTPQPDGKSEGTPSHYRFFAGDDAATAGEAVAQGEFSNIKDNPIPQTVRFAPTKARYVRFEITQTVDGGGAVIANLNVAASDEI